MNVQNCRHISQFNEGLYTQAIGFKNLKRKTLQKKN